MDSERTFTYNDGVGENTEVKNKRERVILHMDGDAFFVGVEMAKNPRLKGRPVVTGEERGIVSALSYEAKAIGIVRGMPIYRVRRDFPQVIILPGDYAAYARYSQQMFDIVRRYADEVEEYSIDECFADLTNLERILKMTQRQMAERIKKEIADELHLSVSIGLAPTKVLAKVASKWVKPNGLTVITGKDIPVFLAGTPIGKVWGIGPKTTELLNRWGVKTAADFIHRGCVWVRANLAQPYERLWRELQGEYLSKIDSTPKTIYASIQKTRTFYPPTNEQKFLLSQLSKNIEEACLKARHYQLTPRRISFFLKTKDFVYADCAVTLTAPTTAPEIIVALVGKKLGEIHRKNILYRTTGITLLDLVSAVVTQGDLFGGDSRALKLESVHRQIDLLEEKFGKRVIYLASTKQALSPLLYVEK